jgi:hypothetical protein
MDLRPVMLSVIDVRAGYRHTIADARRGQVAMIPRHQLDYEGAMLLGVVVAHQHGGVRRVEADVEMQVPVLLTAG